MRDERRRWLDDRANVRKIYVGLWVIAILLVALDLFYVKHTHFGAEETFGFFGVFGFVAFAGLVLAGKLFRRIVRRDEDYYDR